MCGTNYETYDDLKELIERHKNEEVSYKSYEFDEISYTLMLGDINKLLKENQQLKIQISAREEEYEKLEDNWNELEQFCIDEQVPEEYDEYNSYIEFSNSVYENVLNKMEKLKQGCDSNE